MLSIVVCLATLEVGLRLAGAKYECSFYESDPVLYTAFRPNAEGWEIKEGENFVHINAYGMRDRERSLIAAPGTTRIAVLGDSMVAAQQVPLDNTMSQLLETKLNAELGTPDHPIEVLNFAVGSSRKVEICLNPFSLRMPRKMMVSSSKLTFTSTATDSGPDGMHTKR